MNSSKISTHVFVYYLDEGIWLLKKLKEFYNGHIFLSLIEDNPYNDKLLHSANDMFDVNVTYVKNKGTDQIGFYNTFKLDSTKKDWILYLHDKSADKTDWLQSLINPLINVDNSLLYNDKIGIISSLAHKNKVTTIDSISSRYKYIGYQYRRCLVESIHTVVWLKELQRILFEKHNLIDEDNIYNTFCAGNIFLARRNIIERAHDCVYDDFFNDGYRSDGEIGHGLERFYFYVSECLGYTNLYI